MPYHIHGSTTKYSMLENGINITSAPPSPLLLPWFKLPHEWQLYLHDDSGQGYHEQTIKTRICSKRLAMHPLNANPPTAVRQWMINGITCPRNGGGNEVRPQTEVDHTVQRSSPQSRSHDGDVKRSAANPERPSSGNWYHHVHWSVNGKVLFHLTAVTFTAWKTVRNGALVLHDLVGCSPPWFLWSHFKRFTLRSNIP